ncbi:hypothetical protein LMG31841_04310 [Paraburkholderia saeva]|uniref:Uncharacterized protein n=1 Tax=Paraburkholderia saeva TaxID=2777537 RepID=A0A9N8S0P1_9BURK|nr:hypothetical protein R70241_00601 [Paraburkholderia saeva]CAG4913872.1 hypothetical protein LMG31841_04310 [Paraburkholderia saeva]
MFADARAKRKRSRAHLNARVSKRASRRKSDARYQTAQRAISKRNSGSGGSSGESSGRSTLITEPWADGVSVTKYELCELEPTVSSVEPLTRDVSTRERRLTRQLAISTVERCDETYNIGSAELVFGVLPDEPHAARTATGSSKRSLFMSPVVGVPVNAREHGARAERDTCSGNSQHSATKAVVLRTHAPRAMQRNGTQNRKAAITKYTRRYRMNRPICRPAR